MKSTILPIHPTTGLRALGMSKRGPIWPVLGGDGTGDGDTGDKGDGADGGDGDGDGDLGDGGKKALNEERSARRAAEKRAKDAEAALKAIEDSKKSDAEKDADRISELEKKSRRADQYEAAAKAGLSLDLASRIQGETLDEMIADAKSLNELVGTGSKSPHGNYVPGEGDSEGNPSEGLDKKFVKNLFDAAKKQ